MERDTKENMGHGLHLEKDEENFKGDVFSTGRIC